MKPQTFAEISIVIVTILWGLTFPVIRIAVQDLDGRYFVAIRFWIAFLAFIPIGLWVGISRDKLRETRGPGILTGFLMSMVFLFQTIGLQTISSPRAAFITSSYVIFVPLISPFFGRKMPSLGEFVASFVALTGLFLIMNPDTTTGVSSGDLWVLGCAISSAVGIQTLARLLKKNLDIMALIVWQLGTIAFFSTLTILVGPPATLLTFSQPAWISLLICALGVTLGAFILQVKCQKLLPPERVALVYSLEPIFAVIFGYLILGELLTLRSLLGGLLILSAVIGPKISKLVLR